jgi:hypothetical protein
MFIGVVAPFVGFTIYWGASKTGMLREGFQALILIVLVAVAIEQEREGFAWLRSRIIRGVLMLRPAEILAIAIAPTLLTAHGLIDADFRFTDTVALLAMVSLCVTLGALVWSERLPIKD